jgi:hypothetical protein
MITLHYIGAHKGDGILATAGDKIIRWAQRGYSTPARHVTHAEALLSGDCNSATIGSSSLFDDNADGITGVRIKSNVKLNANHWIVLDLPDIPTSMAYEWFQKHQGEPYDCLGSVGSVTSALFQHNRIQWYCNEAVGASMNIKDPHMMCPAAFYTLLMALGAKDITEEFFCK